MKFFTKTLRGRLYLLLVIMSLITVIVGAYLRYEVEVKNDGVAIVLNYEQMLELSIQSDESIQWWLNDLSDAGATALSINEELLIEYLKKNFVPFYVSGQLKNNPELLSTLSDAVVKEIDQRDNYDLIIVTDGNEDYDRISAGLLRYESLQVTLMEGRIVLIDGAEDELIYEVSGDLTNADGIERYYYKEIIGNKALQLPIGFDEKIINQAYIAGLQVLLRPANHSDYSEEMISNYKNEIDKYKDVMPLLLTYGKEELGYNGTTTDYVDETFEFVQDTGYAVALTESNVQRQYGNKDGLTQLVNGFESPEFVRVFSMWPYIQERYIYPGYSHGEEIGNAMYRAVTERNIRVILFNPFKWNESEYVTMSEDYHHVFESLSQRLATHGYSLGTFTVLDDFIQPSGIRILLYIEILLFGVLLINEGIYPMNKVINLLLSFAAIIGGFGLHYVAPNSSVKLFAFLASVIFASLAGVVYYNVFLANDRLKGNFFTGIVALIVSGLIALAGGVYIGSVMADTMYFLEVELFTGVKISLLAPIAVIVVFVALKYIKDKAGMAQQNILVEVKEESLALLRQPIQVKHLILMVLALGVGYLYLARSGHESGVEPMSLEIIMRNFLENVLPARPRNKEFLIAFPLIIIGMCYKKFFDQWVLELRYMIRLLFMGVAAIGFTSVTNTFSHIRAPLMISLVRTLISIGFGVIIAVVMYIGIEVVLWLLKKFIKVVRDRLVVVD